MTVEEFCQLSKYLEKETLKEEDLDKVIKYWRNVRKAYLELSPT